MEISASAYNMYKSKHGGSTDIYLRNLLFFIFIFRAYLYIQFRLAKKKY